MHGSMRGCWKRVERHRACALLYGSSPPAEVWRQQPSKVFLLTLTLILLPPKGGLGAQPQGFDFDFDSFA